MRTLPGLLAAALLAGCLAAEAPDGRIEPPPPDSLWTVPLPPSIDAAEMLLRHHEFVRAHPARNGNSADHEAARSSLAKELSDLDGELRRSPYSRGTDGENICLWKNGTGQPGEVVVVLGHYDSAGTVAGQGAYDNGAGVRMVVELARAFQGLPLYHSSLFCAIDGGDAGYAGSAALLEDLQDDDVRIRSALLLDGFGLCWPLRTPIQFVHNDEGLLRSVDEARQRIGVPDDHFRASATIFGGHLDEGPWMDAGVPTGLLISGIEETGVGGPSPVPGTVVAASYPFLHRGDTVETLTAFAGGPERLRASFQTALDLAAATASAMIQEPTVSEAAIGD